MIFLFVGMIAHGISARVALLSHRGGWLLSDQAKKPIAIVAIELLASVLGIAAFILSFLLFEWWWPLTAFVLGYWLIAPFVVTRGSFPFFYQADFVLMLVGICCSLAICTTYFRAL